jgi:HEAT repeat protein
VKERAARALGELGPATPEIVTALIASIQTKDPVGPVNGGSIAALGRIGPQAGDALPVLRKYLDSPDPETQLAAYRSIGQIVKADLHPLEQLNKIDQAVNWKVADGGYAVFRAIQEARAAFAVPALLETFRQEPPTYVKGTVIETLGKLQSGDAAVIQLLLDTLPARWGSPGDPPAEKFLSDRARDALARLKSSDPQAVPILAKALSHSNPQVRKQAALALRKFGPKASPSVPALLEVITRADAKTSTHEIGACLDALRAIGPDARSAADTLVPLLSERSRLYRNQDKFLAHYLQAYILVTLADIGVPAGAKPYILDLLSNSDKTLAHGYAAAARAAGTLGAQIPEAIPGLLRSLQPEFPDFPMSFQRFAIALGPEDASCRLEALRALAKMGAKAAEAVPLISRLAEEKPAAGIVVPPWDEEARRALRAISAHE